LFGVVRRILLRPVLRDRFGGAAAWLAATAAVLWVVHPLQTESVTYIIQRVESMMGLFYLLTLYCFLRGAEAARPVRWYVAAVLACLAGMASKEVMVSAPLMVLVCDRTFFAGSFRDALKRRAGLYAGLAATWLPLVYWVSSTGGRAGSAGFDSPVPWWQYAIIQCPAIVHYLRLSFWPRPLVFDYGIMDAPGLTGILLSAAFLLALAGLTAVALWRREPAGCLGAWFFMILAPSSSFVPVATESMAEHRMYLPLAAAVVLAVLALYRLIGLRVVPLAAALAVALGWVTSQRNEDYRSEFTIWSDTVAKRPDNARACNDLGSLWIGRGNLAEAERCFRAALHEHDNYPSAQYNLGIVLQRTNRDEEAIAHFLRALRLEPGFVDAYVNAGNSYLKLGRPAAAVAQFEEALRRQPDSADLHYDLGLALNQLGRAADAMREYQSALHLQSDFAKAHFALAELFRQQNSLPEAMGEYQRTVQAEPGNLQARLILGNLLLMSGQVDGAIDQYEQILRVHPGIPSVMQNLEQARAMKSSPSGGP
jgi:tetratricopeptide (TPR) repeat protein